MHTVALSNYGIPFSWGCNDDKALGRSGDENLVMPVKLELLVDGIAVGNSHSIFYNTVQGVALMCGLYRVSHQLLIVRTHQRVRLETPSNSQHSLAPKFSRTIL
jgi:hypothetical protein